MFLKIKIHKLLQTNLTKHLQSHQYVSSVLLWFFFGKSFKELDIVIGLGDLKQQYKHVYQSKSNIVVVSGVGVLKEMRTNFFSNNDACCSKDLVALYTNAKDILICRGSNMIHTFKPIFLCRNKTTIRKHVDIFTENQWHIYNLSCRSYSLWRSDNNNSNAFTIRLLLLMVWTLLLCFHLP